MGSLEYAYIAYLYKSREVDVMASDTNENALADFDIDEVIDWDKHDIPSKVCWVYS